MTEWKYEIKHGPEGEANYAWIYKGDLFVATMRTHHAVEIVKALSASPAGVVKPLNWEEDRGFWKAQTNLIACYSVWDCGDHWECSLLDGQFPSAEAAKSAAFADYSARIMSAIEPAGVGVETAAPGHVVGAVWNEIGTALALLSEEDASPKARTLIRQALESATGCKAPQYLGGAPTPADWSDMAKAPKDGTMLRLLVNPDKEEFTAFDDSLTPFETIGFNNLADTGEDRWEFAGWDWSQDCFITGRGEVIGWAQMSPKPDGSAATSEYKPVVCVGRPTIDKLTSGEHVETEKVILIPASDLNPSPQPRAPALAALKGDEQ